MPARNQRRRLVLEGGLLGVGSVVTALLVVVGLSLDDGSNLGAAALARQSGAIADALVAEWERCVHAPNALDELSQADALVWIAPAPLAAGTGTGPAPGATERDEPDEPPRTDFAAFDTLFAEARRLGARPDPTQGSEHARSALELLTEALEKRHDALRGADALLERARLGARPVTAPAASAADRAQGPSKPTAPAGTDASAAHERVVDADVARAAWRSLLTEGDPRLAHGDTSHLVLATLAVTELLDADERRWAARRLAALVRERSLVLPIRRPESTGRAALDPLTFTEQPLRTEMLRRLTALAPDDAEVRATFENDRLRLTGELLRAAFGELPRTPPFGRLGPHALVLALSPESADGAGAIVRARPLEADSLRLRLARLATELELLPAGFALDTGADPNDSAGELVRPRTTLTAPPGVELGFALRHEDPSRIIDAERGRMRLFRGALFTLAVFVVVATVAGVRALRRERKLASLKSSFIANVSHELRTPLSSILLLAENLESGRVSEPAAVRRYHATIKTQAERLRRLVDDVLDFSRLERGQHTRPERVDIDLVAFSDELVREFEPRVRAAGGRLQLERDDAPANARFDADAIRRAVSNLVDNALLHSGSTEIELAFRGRNGRGLAIEVRDHGRGIAPERRAQVFQPFSRLTDGTTSGAPPPGAGLGLAIVREIARAHGGDVALDAPDEGSGCVFRLELPEVEADTTTRGTGDPLPTSDEEHA